MIRAILCIILALFLLSPVATAQGFVGGKADEKKNDDKNDDKKNDKKDAKKQATPLDRMIRDLKALIAREKVKPAYDKKLVKELDSLVRTHEKNRKPISFKDLSEADQKRLRDEVRKQLEKEFRERVGGGDGGGGGGGGDWAERAASGRVTRVMDAAGLTDDEKGKVQGLLTDFAKDSATAVRNGDNKLIKDLKNDLEKQLKKKIGYNKTKKVMNEVNKQFGGRGRGGR